MYPVEFPVLLLQEFLELRLHPLSDFRPATSNYLQYLHNKIVPLELSATAYRHNQQTSSWITLDVTEKQPDLLSTTISGRFRTPCHSCRTFSWLSLAGKPDCHLCCPGLAYGAQCLSGLLRNIPPSFDTALVAGTPKLQCGTSVEFHETVIAPGKSVGPFKSGIFWIQNIWVNGWCGCELVEKYLL